MPTRNDELFTVDFDLSGTGRYVEGQNAVYPNSLLFRAGEYKDKKFTASAEDLKAMAEGWKPVKGNIEHKKFLRGRAGVIPSVWTEEDGQVLRGVVKIPLALDGLLTAQEKKVSLEIHRQQKTASGFALTTDPRVDDAVLMSLDKVEFDRHDTPHGQRGMQELHDTAVRYGAVCTSGNADMASAHENEAAQSIHDLACEHGAVCDKVNKKRYSSGYGYWSRSKDNTKKDAATGGKKGHPMSLKQTILNFLRGHDVDEKEAAEFADDLTEQLDKGKTSDESTDFSKAMEEIGKLRAEMARKDAATIVAQFSDRITPGERPGLIALFAQAAADDAREAATVTFSVGDEEKSGSRVAMFTAVLSARPKHEMLTEQMRSGETEGTVLLNKSQTEERKKQTTEGLSASEIYSRRSKASKE